MTDLTALTDEELSDRCSDCNREMWRRRYDKPAVQAALTAITDSKATSDVQLAVEVLGGLRAGGWRVVRTDPTPEASASGKTFERPIILEEWTP
jgi:hypothetical protein